jgi:hypothetical protein
MDGPDELAQRRNAAAECTLDRGHACARCRPEEFPELAPRCPDCAKTFEPADNSGPSSYPPPVLTLDGAVVAGYWRGYKIGPEGWVDLCGMTPGSVGAHGLHLCPCAGTHQCYHRARGDVRVA